MGSVKVDLVRSGIVDVTKSDGVRALLEQQAQQCASRCNAMRAPEFRRGNGYKAYTKELTYLVGGVVCTTDMPSIVDNYKNNTLKKGCNA